VKSVIEHNDYNRIRLTAAGTKVFGKQDAGKGADAQFRVLGEGLPVILPYVDSKSIITGDMATLRILLELYYPLCSKFDEPFRSTIEARAMGSHIVKFPIGEDDGVVLTHDIALPIWKSNVSVTLMMDKKAKSALSLRLYGTDVSAAGQNEQTKVPSETTAGTLITVAEAEEMLVDDE